LNSREKGDDLGDVVCHDGVRNVRFRNVEESIKAEREVFDSIQGRHM